MALRDTIPKEETITVQGQAVRIVPLDYDTYLVLQQWISEHSPHMPGKKTPAGKQEEFGIQYTAKCIQLACPQESLTDEEAVQVLIANGGSTGTLAKKAMAACGTPTEVGTATALPT